jgi:hypothetical protein
MASHRKRHKAYAVMTESAFMIYRQKGIPRSIKRLFWASWFDLKRLEETDGALTLTFHDPVTIQSPNQLDLACDIFLHCRSFLSDAELPAVPGSGLPQLA